VTQAIVRAASAAEFDASVVGSEPIHVPGGVADWPACGGWTTDYLARAVGDVRVTVKVSRSGDFGYRPDGEVLDGDDQSEMTDRRLSDALTLIEGSAAGGPKYYVAQQMMDGALSALGDDLRFPSVAGSFPVALWCGSAGTASQLHFDRGPNLFAQISGEKHFTLFDPADSPYLYQYSGDCRMSHLSEVNVGRPDPVRHPLVSHAVARTVTVRAGDLLYIPPYWWHYVRSTSVALSVNQWRREEASYRCTPNALPLLRADYRRYRDDPANAPRGPVRHWLAAAHDMASVSATAAVLVGACTMRMAIRDGDSRRGEHDFFADPAMLETWQGLVVAALDERGIAQRPETETRIRECLEVLRQALAVVAA
jgi:hypothetical protein